MVTNVNNNGKLIGYPIKVIVRPDTNVYQFNLLWIPHHINIATKDINKMKKRL